MFFKAKKVNSVSQLYYSKVNQEVFVIEKILKLTDKKPINFTINYGKVRKFTSLMSELQKIPFDKIENLNIFDDMDRELISLRKVFSYLKLEKLIYQLTFTKSIDKSFDTEVKLFNILNTLGDIEYGYSRFLREDYSYSTEIKLSSFFGSVKVTDEREEWLINPDQLLNGAFKGFYPLNYFKPDTLNLVKEHIGDIKLESHPQNDCLFLINEQTQKKLAKNRALKKYLHFTSTS